MRPDFRDLDATRDVRRIEERVARIAEQAPRDRQVVLAGSSMGAFTSVLASTHVNCVGLFLIALPVAIPNFRCEFVAPPVPTALVHGWDDEICPVDAAIDFARARGDAITLVRDDHRLGEHVDFIADGFARFLAQFA